MANALYDKGREAFLNGGINWLSDDIRVILTDASDYTVSLATHQNLLAFCSPRVDANRLK